MKHNRILRILLWIVILAALPAGGLLAQESRETREFGENSGEWSYVVTGKAGPEGLQVYYVSGEPAFVLKKGDRIEISEFRDDFPDTRDPDKSRRGAVITSDMEDYIIYLDEEGLIVPQSEYRYERLLPGLGGIANRNPAKNQAILLLGLVYLALVLYASRGFYFVQVRSNRLGSSAGWSYLAAYLVVLAAESYVLLTYSNPVWFLNFSESGFFKGVLFLLLMIVYLYLKYLAANLALYPLQHTHRLEDTPFNAPKALILSVIGTWLLLSVAEWEGAWVPYLSGALAVATVAGVAWTLRRALRQAGPLLAILLLAVVLASGATLSYLACEVLARIIQILVIGFCIYALFASAGMKSAAPDADPDHTTYVDYEGNAHDLYRQSDGTYVDYRDNSRWNRVSGGNSDRFDRIY